MKKIILLSCFVFLIFSSIVTAYNLNSIEDAFVKDGEVTSYVVVAGEGSSSDILAQIDIIGYLNQFSDQPATDNHKLVSEIDDIYERDIITIGNPCINTMTKEIMNYKGDCDFEEGLIKFYNKNGKTQLVIYGTTDSLTRSATRSLINQEYSGEETAIVSSTEEPEVKSQQEKAEEIIKLPKKQNKETLEEGGFCGDAIRQSGEDCSNCPTDIKCSSNAYCDNGVCIPKKTFDYSFLYIALIIIFFGGISFSAYLILSGRRKKKESREENKVEEIKREKRKEKKIVVNYSDLENYVENALKIGYGKGQIKDLLLKSGWEEKDVDFVFRHFNQK